MYDICIATLIVILIFGLFTAFFATQNTGAISLHFLDYTVSSIPAYIALGLALLIGILLSWILSLANRISSLVIMRGKESKIKDFKKENAELTRHIHQLELENARLRGETKDNSDDKSL